MFNRRRGSGSWITRAMDDLKQVGRYLLYAWIIVGWVIFIPWALYVSLNILAGSSWG